MRKPANLLFLIIFLLSAGSSQKIFGQDLVTLEFLDDYPIKIDGGCSFFTYDTTSLAKGKFVFVVSATKRAFFKQNGKFIYCDLVKRELKQNGYIDHFAGSNSKHLITLDVNKDKKTGKDHTNYAGVLKIFLNKNVKTIQVNGINEEHKLSR